MKIGNNIMSLRAYNALLNSQRGLSKSSERISTGVKINSIADDPAAFSISSKLERTGRRLNQASANSSDGVNVVATAEGALSQVQDMVTRMRELAVQLSTGTYTTEDRNVASYEFEQLKSEIDDIAFRTEFNGKKLLYGEADNITTIPTAGIKTVRTTPGVPAANYKLDITTIPEQTTFKSGPTTGPVPAGTLTLNGEEIKFDGTETANEITAKISYLANNLDITATDTNSDGVVDKFVSNYYGADYDIVFGGDSAVLTALGIDTGTITQPGIDIEASVNDIPMQNPTIVTESNKIRIYEGAEEIVFEVDRSKVTATGSYDFTEVISSSFVVQTGTDTGMDMKMNISRITAETLEIDRASINSQENANKALDILDKAMNYLVGARSNLGAYQNRLEYSVSSVDDTEVAISTSLSTVKDTDIAREMSEYTKYQIMSEAAISMLAQANQTPQSLLQLLRD